MLNRTFNHLPASKTFRPFSTLLLTTPLTKGTPTFGSANLSALNCTKTISGSEAIHVLTPTSPSLASAKALIHESIATSTLLSHESFENPTASSLLQYLSGYLKENPEITTVVAPSTSFYKDLLPQLAAMFDS